MSDYGMEIIGLSEVRWKDFGEITTQNGNTLSYSEASGDDAEHKTRVGLVLSKTARRSLIVCEPISDKITTGSSRSLIRCMLCPNRDSRNRKESCLPSTVKRDIEGGEKKEYENNDGYMNAQIGPEKEGLEHVMGRHGIGNTNKNGERLIDLCANDELVIRGTVFPHKKCHKVTWVSPDYRTENQINHIAIDRKFTRSLTDAQNKRVADIASDHHLVTADFKFKIKGAEKKFEVQN
jgi:hypothetical protein